MQVKNTILSAVAIALMAVSVSAESIQYKLDPAHSSVGFSVSHMVISQVKGTFSSSNGIIKWDDKNPANSYISGTVQIKSLSTNNADRDKHLLSDDFFAEKKYPSMTFESKKIQRRKSGAYEVTGDLTIHGVTKSIKAPLTVTQIIKDPWGMTRRGFSTELTINRKDFGMSWNKALDNGGLAVGEKVIITLSVEAIQQ